MSICLICCLCVRSFSELENCIRIFLFFCFFFCSRPDGLLVDSELQLSSGIKCCAFDDALERGFVATDKCTIWFIDWLDESAKQNKHLVSSHTRKINQICCLDDNKYLSSVGDDGSLIIWSASDRERVFQIDEKSIQVCPHTLFSFTH